MLKFYGKCPLPFVLSGCLDGVGLEGNRNRVGNMRIQQESWVEQDP